MSFSTIAAARQNEMKASMAVVATSTRGAPDVCFSWGDGIDSLFMKRQGITAKIQPSRSECRNKHSHNFYAFLREAAREGIYAALPTRRSRPRRYLYH